MQGGTEAREAGEGGKGCPGCAGGTSAGRQAEAAGGADSRGAVWAPRAHAPRLSGRASVPDLLTAATLMTACMTLHALPAHMVCALDQRHHAMQSAPHRCWFPWRFPCTDACFLPVAYEVWNDYHRPSKAHGEVLQSLIVLQATMHGHAVVPSSIKHTPGLSNQYGLLAIWTVGNLSQG